MLVMRNKVSLHPHSGVATPDRKSGPQCGYCGFFITALTQQLKKLKTVYENTTFYIRKQVPRTVIFSLFRNKSNLRISCLDRRIFCRVKHNATLESRIQSYTSYRPLEQISGIINKIMKDYSIY